MLTSLFRKLSISAPSVRYYCSVISSAPTTIGNNLPISVAKKPWEFPPTYLEPRQAWIENLDTIAETKLGLIDLHPDIFAASPRIDIIHRNIRWQRLYRFVSYAASKTRAEKAGSSRKPWPQKGLGKARHGSVRSPIWRGGGRAHGPRPFTTHFFMLPFHVRVRGLMSTLAVKHAQDDLHIVNHLEIPTDDKQFVLDLIEERNWGPSVLIVDDYDIMPRNITVATDAIPHVNLMPTYGLNVYSMLKHDTLVITVAAIERLEEKLLEFLNTNNDRELHQKFKSHRG